MTLLDAQNKPTAGDAADEPAMPERLAIERAAYEHCITTGEAAIGRAAFSARRAPGEAPPWGPRRL